MTASVPFAERGGWMRGLLDLATARYPFFLFGGPIGRVLPVFHLHDVEPEVLEAQLRHLADHGYDTITSEAIARFVQQGTRSGPRAVALCFDDAKESLWRVAFPLLRRYGMQAITFAIPGRMEDAAACRPHFDDPARPSAAAESGSEFVTWPELRAMHESGIIDVQSHSYSHASIFCDPQVSGFVTPSFAKTSALSRPIVSVNGEPRFLSPSDLGAPLYLQRSRFSDAVRFFDDPQVREACMAHVRQHGGAEFFGRPSWEQELRALTANGRGRLESDEERERTVREDLGRAREVLNSRLGTNSVRYLCFPWGVGGVLARRLARETGYETAFSERLFGLRAVRTGDDPYRLMRLNGKFITWLPR